MFRLYNRQRIKEEQLVVEEDYTPILFSSVSSLYDCSIFGETLTDKLGNEFWNNIVSKMFKLSIINLLFSKKITAIYFADKKSIFFNQFVYKHEGFNIYAEDNISFEKNELLEYTLLSVIEKTRLNEIENFPTIISETINQYIGTSEMNRPQKKFVFEYLKNYSNKNQWIDIKSNTKFLGIMIDYELIIRKSRKRELEKSYNYLNSIVYERRRYDLHFRNFLMYIDKTIEKDFNRRIPSTD